jgi:hypothetical protein
MTKDTESGDKVQRQQKVGWLGLTKHKQIAAIVGIVIIIIVVTALIGVYGPVVLYSVIQGHSCTRIPCSYIKNGNFTFVFKLQNGSVENWYFPQSEYDHYLTAPKYTPVISLKLSNGTSVETYDYRALITPSFFANAAPSLTAGHNAKQFLNEVINIKNQLTVFSLVFQNTSAYPAVILAKGTGDCKDFAVLMASIIEAGNIQANYGMKVQFVYVDAYNLSDPKTINHLLLYVTFANGTGEFIDTTNILNGPTTPIINGWYFNLTCNSTSCETTQTCQAGYVYGNDSLCHLACGSGNSYCASGEYCYNNGCIACPEGTILGNDGACHAECGNATTYCSGNSQCYEGHCVSCPSGMVMGTDNLCHQECGGPTSYCSNGSVCSNNQCVSCPAGMVIGSDGLCHRA